MAESSPPDAPTVTRARIAREWARLGITGFGGPPAHIQLLRRLCVTDNAWIDADEFEDAIAACNLLPGPASTQLAIFCARRVGGWRGAIVGGLGFIVPGLVVILALSALLLGPHPSSWVLGAAAGAGAVIPAVAVQAGLLLAPSSLARARQTSSTGWWAAAVGVGGAVAALAGVWVALALVGCGLIALARSGGLSPRAQVVVIGSGAASVTAGTLAALSWTALKVGALSYGGGFVIIPLMQADAVNHHWLTRTEFLGAVALGQITPGPVVQTVAVVGYGAAGLIGGVLAATVAFAPSFAFILIGGRHFSRLRGNERAQAFLGGAGPAAIGAIIGASVPLALALGVWWQVVILAAGAVALALRQRPMWVIVAGGAIGLVIVAVGGTLPR
jgi:chromate transporter